MKDYIVITDVNADITPEIASELGVQVISMRYTIGGKEYNNCIDDSGIPINEFYDKIREGELASTTQRNANEFVDEFTPFLEGGNDIIYIGFSSGLSGSFNQSAVAARELKEKFPEREIITVDSKAASMGQALLVYHAMLKKREGLSITELEQWVVNNRDNLIHSVVVDDLFHLKRGGRVSAASAIIGSALNIKPILRITDDGHLEPIRKVRGRKQALDSLVDAMEENAIVPKNQMVYISHADAEDDAKYVKEQISKRFGTKDFRINFIGPVIGGHTGTGTVALFYIGKHK